MSDSFHFFLRQCICSLVINISLILNLSRENYYNTFLSHLDDQDMPHLPIITENININLVDKCNHFMVWISSLMSDSFHFFSRLCMCSLVINISLIIAAVYISFYKQDLSNVNLFMTHFDRLLVLNLSRENYYNTCFVLLG